MVNNIIISGKVSEAKTTSFDEIKSALGAKFQKLANRPSEPILEIVIDPSKAAGDDIKCVQRV